jgi:hypothetical protein
MVLRTIISRWTTPLRSIVAALAVFILGGLSDVWLRQHGAGLLVAILDDALIGIGAGLLVFFYERRLNRNIIRKLEVIRLMNHHVRNSLQVISLAASVPQREELAGKIQNAVERIEWALREVLPGQREDIDDLLFDSHTNESRAEKPKIVS